MGLSHHQVNAETLTTFTSCVQRVVDDVRALPGVHGLVLLATCNRCELYLDADRFHTTVRAVRELLVEAGAGELAEQIGARAAENAIEHLFRVACGLDSMVVGETEIIGQVRAAIADDAVGVSSALRRCFQQALSTAKQVASTTDLGGLGRSVASVALDLVEQRHRHLAGRQAVVLGTGAYAGVVCADLIRRGAQVSVHSASGRATAFAQTHPVTALTDEELPDAIARAGVLVACSGTGERVLTAEAVRQARSGVFGTLPIVDLALGRDIAPELAQTEGVELIDLDVIARHAPHAHADAVIAAQATIDRAVADHMSAERRRLADPAVTAIRAHVYEIFRTELDSVAATQSPEVVDALTRSLHRVANALLHTPSVRAAASATNGELDEYAIALQTIFGIEVPR